MKEIKNILKIGLLAAVLLFGANAKAITTAYSLASGGVTNIFQSPVRLTQVIVQGTNAALSVSTWFFDAPSTLFTNLVAGYTNTTTYGTNFIQSYTNFYGRTNFLTNFAIVDVSNAVSASTNVYPLRLAPVAAAGVPTILDNVNYYFINGLTITNSGTGTATISITYQQ